MKFNLAAQSILAQLNNLYKTNGTFGLYDLVYDFLMTQIQDLGISLQRKIQLWEASNIRFNKERSSWIGKLPPEKVKQEIHKYYKSSLAAEYLLSILRDSNQKLNAINIEGVNNTLLTITGYNEEN